VNHGPWPLAASQRIRVLLRKELRQIFRDPRMKRLIFVAPVFQLVIFGYAVNTDIRETPLFVVDHSATYESRELVNALTASGYFRVVGRSPRPEALSRALDRGDAMVGIQIPPTYAADLKAGRGAAVQIVIDGTNSNTATVVQGNVLRIVQQLSERHMAAGGGVVPAGVELRIRAWFNPDLASRVYNVPAVMALIVLLMTLLLTALTVVRERELGTLEQLSVTPLSPGELILGKTLPVAMIAMVQLGIIMVVAIFWFGIPFRGSFPALLVAAFIYIVAGLACGLLISTFSRTQQEALMAMFLFFMPAIILSGFMFPIFTMPPVFQWITLANPIRHFLEIVRPVFLRGDGIVELWPQYLWLVALAAAALLTARWRFARQG
jgi:ABC-2 type transport system permease protein